MSQLSQALIDAQDPDQIQAQAIKNGADPTIGATDQELETARQQLVQRAIIPLAASPELRNFLLEREIVIDPVSHDEVISREFGAGAKANASQLIGSFKEFIQTHKDEITALQIIYNRPYAQRHLDFAQVRELAEHLNQDLHQTGTLFVTEALWQAYTQVEKDRVHGAGEKRVLADLVSLVRHVVMDEELVPYPERVQARYQEWLSGKVFTPQQRWWLDEIARHIGINVSISDDDLNYYGFQARGGQVTAYRLFGLKLGSMLNELNNALGS